MKFLSDIKAFRWPAKFTPGFGTDMTLSRNWVPLIKVLKFLGNAPIQIKKAEVALGLARYEFRVRWFSPGIIIICVWASIRMLFTLTMYSPQLWRDLHYVSPSVWFDNTSMSKTERLIQPLRYYCVPVISWVEWTSLLVFMPNFVKFVNNWQIFEAKAKNWNTDPITIGFKSSFVFVMLALIPFGNVPLRMATNGSSMVVYLAILGILLVIAEDLKMLAMLVSVASGFKKIKSRIEEFIQETRTEVFRNKSNEKYELKNCQKLHNLLKEQVDLIQSSQGMYEISFLCYLVMVLTINVFLTLSPMFRSDTLNKVELMFNLSHLLVELARLYMKCNFAENITKEEKLLADRLYSSQLWDIPEAKAFADSIVWNPTKVVYGSVITMDKRLILKIAGQILTYIIILLQFQLSFGTN